MGHRESECGEEEQEEYGGAQGQGHRLLRVGACDARRAVGEEAEIVGGEYEGGKAEMMDGVTGAGGRAYGGMARSESQSAIAVMGRPAARSPGPGPRTSVCWHVHTYIQPNTDIPAP